MKASRRSGRASTLRGSADGYGTGAGDVPDCDCTGKYSVSDFGSGNIDTLRDNSAEHVEREAVRFDNNIDARSARIDFGFCNERETR